MTQSDQNDLAMAFRYAVLAAEKHAAEARPYADVVHAMLAAVPWQGLAGEPLAIAAFDAVASQLELALPPERIFEAAMLAGELLAAHVLAFPAHAEILRRWAERPYGGTPLAAMRACSKLCRYDTGLVDGAMLCALADRDDLGPATLGYLGQVAGRLRGEEKGELLIEQLGHQAATRRVVAAHAITYSEARDPPSTGLSAFERFGPPHLVSGPPSRRLLRLLAALLADTDPEVAAAARRAADFARDVFPEMNEPLANLIYAAMRVSTPQPSASASVQPHGVEFALRAPGRLSAWHGKLSWSPDLLEVECAAEAVGAPLPRAIGAPRLFLSYRWADNPFDDSLIDHVAGLLYGSGYDLVFDRDPRHLDAGRSAEEVLSLMRACTHFLPLTTRDLCAYFSAKRTGSKSALDLEWELARKLARSAHGLSWVTLWLNSDRLPRALISRPFVDLRVSHMPLGAVFPDCVFEVRAFDAKGRMFHRSARLDRRNVRAAYLKASTWPGCVRAEIHDVTRRKLLAALCG